jgi:branched-chain amino acid transport system permease protein
MKQWSAPIVLLVFLVTYPLVITDDYYQDLMIKVLIWVAVGSGWNMISGYTGQVLFGAAAFFGVGAYCAALLVENAAVSSWWGFPLAAVLCVALAFPFGWISFRLRGPYFALVTLALNEILRNIATIWESFTGGMVGVLITPSFTVKWPYYYVALVIAVGAVVATELVVRSRWGYYFVSIREDQDAAESMGINTLYYKMVSLCISALMIGLAGALYTNYMGFIDPKIVFSLHDIAIMAILVGIVGGVATAYGPVVGAFIMVAVQEFVRSAGFGLLPMVENATGWPFLATFSKYFREAHALTFGILVIVVILYLPNGVVGDWQILKRRLMFWKRQAV